MRTIIKYLWGSFFLLSAMLLTAWWALHQNGTVLPGKVLQEMGAHVSAKTPNIALPDIKLPKARDLLPKSRTFYRWTDHDGNTGYSHDLPDNVSAFETIILNGDGGAITTSQKLPI